MIWKILIFFPFLNLFSLYKLFQKSKNKIDLYFLIGIGLVTIPLFLVDTEIYSNFYLFVYFVSIIFYFIKNNKIEQKEQAEAKALMDKIEQDQIEAKRKKIEEYIQSIHDTYPEFADSILGKELKLGMTLPMVKLIHGEEYNRKETINKAKTVEKYNFIPYESKQKNTKYKLEMTFENGLLVGWKEL